VVHGFTTGSPAPPGNPRDRAGLTQAPLFAGETGRLAAGRTLALVAGGVIVDAAVSVQDLAVWSVVIDEVRSRGITVHGR
jgi:hypothetical protein